MTSFREVVKEAFVATLKASEDPEAYPSLLAVNLRSILKREGFSIHRSGECVHPYGPRPKDLGRPMTEAELQLAREMLALEATRVG